MCCCSFTGVISNVSPILDPAPPLQPPSLPSSHEWEQIYLGAHWVIHQYNFPVCFLTSLKKVHNSISLRAATILVRGNETF